MSKMVCEITMCLMVDGFSPPPSFPSLSSLHPPLFLRSLSGHMTIRGVFSVHRAVEQSNFTHSMDNKQLLFHASQVKNFVGILSRYGLAY